MDCKCYDTIGKVTLSGEGYVSLKRAALCSNYQHYSIVTQTEVSGIYNISLFSGKSKYLYEYSFQDNLFIYYQQDDLGQTI